MAEQGPAVSAKGLVHKTDALTGVLTQPMLRGGVEVLIGVIQEAEFGPLVVFGLGGIATDVLGDHSARLSPLNDTDAPDVNSISTRLSPAR